MADVKKVKAINPQIVVHGTLEKPYYEISYYDTTDNQWHIGYSSYDLYIVKEYLDNYFEIIEADVEPVKHGHWIFKERIKLVPTRKMVVADDGTALALKKHITVKVPYCSICGEHGDYEEDATPYCPNCGAKMDNSEVLNND